MQTESPKFRQTQIPLTFRTLVFCVLEGMALGFPVSWLLPEDPIIPVPASFRWIVWWCCLGVLLLLPIWSLGALHRYRGFWLLGIVTFVVVFLIGQLPRG